MLPDILVHDHGGGDTYVQTLDAAELRDVQAGDVRIILPVEAAAEFFVAENEGAFFREGDGTKAFPAFRGQLKESVTGFLELPVASGEILMENRRNLAERSFRRGGIERSDIDQVHGSRTESFGAAENFRNIEAGFELVEDQYEGVVAGSGQQVFTAFFFVAQQRVSISSVGHLDLPDPVG